MGLIYSRPKGSKAIAGLDVITKSNGELLILSHVARDSTAWLGGLTAGDKLVALNDRQVRKSLRDTLAMFEPEQEVTVSFIRRHQLMSTTVKLTTDFDKPKKVKAVKSPTSRQAKLYQAWTGVAHPNLTTVDNK